LPNGADASQSQTQSHPRTDPQAARGTSPSPLDSSSAFAARRAEETARRDRSLAEFLVMLDGYKPLVGWTAKPSILAYDLAVEIKLIPGLQIPEEVTEYYLQRAGFDCSDPRL
jgi:transcription initiation factor TFIID subunit 10